MRLDRFFLMSLQGLLYCPGKFVTSSKVKILFVKKMEIMNKDNEKKIGGCDDALLIYGAPKSTTVYLSFGSI